MPLAGFSPEYSLAELETSLSAQDVWDGESKSSTRVQHTKGSPNNHFTGLQQASSFFKSENVHTSAMRTVTPSTEYHVVDERFYIEPMSRVDSGL